MALIWETLPDTKSLHAPLNYNTRIEDRYGGFSPTYVLLAARLRILDPGCSFSSGSVIYGAAYEVTSPQDGAGYHG